MKYLIYTLLFSVTCSFSLIGQISPVPEDASCGSTLFAESFTGDIPSGWSGDFDLGGGSPFLEGWILADGLTPTDETGPDAPFDGSHYAYFESSGPAPDNAMFQISTPPINLPDSRFGTALTFRLLMHGDETGSLMINAISGGVTTQLLTAVGEQHADGSIANWEEVYIDLTSLENQEIEIQFVGMKSIGDMGDIAIDQVQICGIASPIPTLSEWGLILLFLILSIIGLIYIRRTGMSSVVE